MMRATLPYVQYVLQTADALGVHKVKLVSPVLRGRAKELRPEDLAMESDMRLKFDELRDLKVRLGWSPRIKLALWNRRTEGYALLVYPNRQVYAWPVFDAPDGVVRVGDLGLQSLGEIWQNYPYKHNHIDKYTGLSLLKA
jgi:MoaA/NifB/PqqE/SkfB family radical SAM enzyme